MKTFVIKSELNFKISEEVIDDIMYCAFEGGITYWCDSAECIGETLGEYTSDQISRGGSIKLTELEDSSTSWILTQEKLLNGVKLYVEKTHAGSNIIEDGAVDSYYIDAEVADQILQYALFEEVIYG